MDQNNNKYLFLLVGWLCFATLIKRELGMETLQLFVIISLFVVFIKFGVTGRQRRAGERSVYSFLNPSQKELEDEVVPYQSQERLKSALLLQSLRDVPDETTPSGIHARKLLAREDLSMEAIRRICHRLKSMSQRINENKNKNKNNNKGEVEDVEEEDTLMLAGELCICGSGKIYFDCCKVLVDEFYANL